MGEMDLTEKILVDYNDVFADIINVLIFKGKDVVHSDALQNSSVYSQYKADDQKLHEQERDVAKHWMQGDVELALYGMENQTKIEKYMPFRLFSYDGAAYRSQLLNQRKKVVPVITIVLYFGIVARFFSEKRKNPDYVPNDRTVITHVDAMLKLWAVMAGDRRYEEILKSDDKEEVGCMCDVAERLERKGIEKGRLDEIFDSVQAKDYGIERGAQKANMSIKEFKKAMETAGYKIPTDV